MKVHLDKIGDDGLDVDEPLTQSWLGEMLGQKSAFRVARDGSLRAHLMRTDDLVHVRGRAFIDLSAECSRCLVPVTLPLRTQIEVTLVPAEKEAKVGDGGQVDDDDLGIGTYENREIDLACVVRDEVLLELPMRPLCVEKCAGLCATCGKNLNEGPCTCAPQVDKRWGPLQRLKIN